ncbi:MAG: hypothetical protein QW303_04935, partial [Nitrososphaerota archaeon]
MSGVTFFTKGTRTKEITIGDKNRRKLIITLLESQELLSAKKLSAKSGIAYATTHQELNKFVISGFIKPHNVATYKRIQHSKFELTKDGILVGLAIKFDQGDVMGVQVTDTLVRVLEPDNKAAPINRFMQSVLVNALSRGLIDYVLRFLRDLVKEREISQDLDMWKMAAKGITEAKPSEVDRLGVAVIQTLGNCSEIERNTLVQF